MKGEEGSKGGESFLFLSVQIESKKKVNLVILGFQKVGKILGFQKVELWTRKHNFQVFVEFASQQFKKIPSVFRKNNMI